MKQVHKKCNKGSKFSSFEIECMWSLSSSCAYVMVSVVACGGHSSMVKHRFSDRKVACSQINSEFGKRSLRPWKRYLMYISHWGQAVYPSSCESPAYEIAAECLVRAFAGPPRGGGWEGTMTSGPMDFRGPIGFRIAVGFSGPSRGPMSSRGGPSKWHWEVSMWSPEDLLFLEIT